MAEVLFENEFFVLYKEDFFLGCKIKTREIDRQIAQKLIDERKKITNGQEDTSVYSMVEIGKLETVTKEAREVFSVREAAEGLSATALIAENPITKVVANFYLGFNKPPIPIKIFMNKEEAIKWLKKQSENQ